MAGLEVLQVNLPSELLRFVEERIRAGQGGSAQDVVQDALEFLRGHALEQPQRQAIQEQIAEGLEQARRGEVVDGEQAFDALEARIG